jgi:TrmH family RNA methyltransferase
VAEAAGAGLELVAVFHDEAFDVPDVGDAEVFTVASGVLGRVVDAVTSQGVAAVATIPTVGHDEVLARDGLVVVCDRVGDPGNVGTIARSLEAAGAAGLVLTAGSADPFGPKVVRASAGAVFRIPIATDGGPVELAESARRAGRRVLATTMTGGTAHTSIDLTGRVALVVGNESHGVAPEVLADADELVTIEMDGPTESLNVAMAATVLVFEAQRQRRSAQ